MKQFILAALVAVALGTGASLFYEWTLYRSFMARTQPPAPTVAETLPFRDE